MIILSEYRAPTETLRRTDALDGAGDCLTRRLPADVVALRLLCAADVADILEAS